MIQIKVEFYNKRVPIKGIATCYLYVKSCMKFTGSHCSLCDMSSTISIYYSGLEMLNNEWYKKKKQKQKRLILYIHY